MVFLNRRGYAPVLMCQQCGWSGSCERCDANLTWHRSLGVCAATTAVASSRRRRCVPSAARMR